MQKVNQRKIKNYWLNSKFQTRYLVSIIITGAFLVLVQSYLFYSFTNENYQLLVELSPMTDEAKAVLFSELKRITVYLVILSSLFILAMSLVGLVFSHRTVGPLYQFKKIFDQIRNGKKDSRIQLRPNDDFQDVAQSFNEMMDSLNNKS